jgi:hypothetical protein
MPKLLQWFTVINLRYFLVALHTVFLKGVEMSVLWPEFVSKSIWWLSLGLRHQLSIGLPPRSLIS